MTTTTAKGSRLTAAMGANSVWSAALALALLAVLGWTARPDGLHAEGLYLMALALFHGIYAIWFAKGRALPAFARATVPGRAVLGLVYLGLALQLAQGGLPTELPAAMGVVWTGYLAVQGGIDLLGAAVTAWAVRGMAVPPVTDAERGAEGRNRFLFACYMGLLAVWMTCATAGFLHFLHLPATVFPGWRAGLPGPVQVLALQVALLAYYNFVAVRHHLHPLIEAGVRGGLFTCVFMLALVLAGLVHPRVLLLPLVDFISVAWIGLSRLRARLG